jgi:WD40 repeat protein
MRHKIRGLLLIVIVVLSVWHERSVVYGQAAPTCANADADYPQYVAISDNGKYVAARWWKQIRLWEAATGRFMTQINTDGTGFDSAVFSPVSQQLLVGEETKATLWNVESGKQVRVFPNTNIKGTWANRAEFSDDGEWILAKSGGHLDIWETKSGKKLHEFVQYPPVDDIYVEPQVSTRKTYLLTQHPHDTFNVWDIRGYKLIQTFKASSARLSPDEQFILIDEGTSLSLRTLPDNRVAWTISYGDDYIDISRGDVFSPDGKYIVGREDHWASDGSWLFRTIHLWDAKSGKALYEFGNEETPLERAYFLLGSKYLFTRGQGASGLYLWDFATKKIIRRIPNDIHYIAYDITADGKYLLLIVDPCRVVLWDFEAGKEIREFR